MSFSKKYLQSLSTTLKSLSKEVHESPSSQSAGTSNIPSNSNTKTRSNICHQNISSRSSSSSLKQQPINFPIIRAKQRTNPYKKSSLQQEKTSPISLQTRIQNHFPNDDIWIGSKICQLESSAARVWIQNVNGLQISDNFSIFTEQLQYLRKFEIGILCLSETCTNAHNPYVYENIEASTKLVYPESTSTLVNTYLQSDSIHQRGGVYSATLRDPLAARVANNGKDPFGRFAWIDFYGKCNFLRIYTIYRVNDDTDQSTGDTTAWADQRTVLLLKGIKINPRKHIIQDLIHRIQQDHQLNRNVIICGDINENVLSPKGTNQKFKDIGLINPLETFIRCDQKIRTHNRGKTIIDGIWMSHSICQQVLRVGIAPFNTMFPSDHRGIYFDLRVQDFLDNNSITAQPSPYRRLKASIPRRVELYGEKVDELYRFHKIQLKIKQSQEIIHSLTQDDSKFLLNKLDQEIHDILTCSEKCCSNVSRHCQFLFSDELQKALRNFRQISHQLDKEIRISNSGSKTTEDMIELIKNKRKSKREVTKCVKNQEELRNIMLDTLAEDKVKFCKDRQLKKSSVIKQLKNCEASKQDSKKINFAIDGPKEGGISYVLIPAASEYPLEQRNSPNFNHKQVETIWNRLNTPNWKQIRQWDRIDDAHEVITYTTHFLKKHFGQSNGTPFTSQEWVKNLSDESFQNSILQGELPPNINLLPAAKDILYSFKTNLSSLREVPFLPTWKQFLHFISIADEKTSASPSSRHYGHYKSLMLVAQDMLKSIFDLMCMALSKGIVLDRWKNTITTLLCKEKKKPYIHRLRPIHIVEVELQFISKYLWSKNLMKHAENEKLITNSQYGGRKNRQAQSSVLNTILSFDYHRQNRIPFTFNIDDLKANFDRELAHFSAMETRSYGLPFSAGDFMIKTTQSQRFFIKTKSGISESFYSYSPNAPIWGLGQGISWAGVAWQFTATTLANCLESKCTGAIFTNPSNSIKLYQFLKFFIDDTTKICNTFPSTSTLIAQNRINMQYHANFVHATGGALALDKCSFYHITYSFDSHCNPIITIPNPDDPPLQISTEYGPTSTIRRLDPHSSSKILGCLIAPSGTLDDQLAELISFAREWKSRILSSTLSPYLIYHSYVTKLLPKLTYRLPVTSFSFTQCESIMKIVRPILLHSFGTHKNFPKAIMEAGDFYAGFGITHLFDLQGYYKFKFLKHHLLQMDDTGTLLHIQLQQTQFEIGRSQPFFNLAYESHHQFVTSTWSSNFWEYLSSRSLQMDLSLPIILPKQRIHDEFIMDLLSPLYTTKELTIINKVRLHLNVLFLSDITNLRGNQLLPQINSGILNRTSTLNWPPQPIQKSWLLLWKKACAKLQNHLSRCHLGSWICSHQKWHFNVSTCNQYAQNDRLKYIKKASSSCYIQIPHTSVLPPLPNVADFYTSKSGIILSTSIPHPPPSQYSAINTPTNSFFSYGLFERDQETEQKIIDTIRSNTAKMCADGSVKNELGSFAYCLAGRGSDVLFKQHAPVHGDKHQITSTRCELMGLLACVKYLEYLSKKYHFDKKYTILISADNQPAVKATSQLRPSPKCALIPDIDIIQELSSSIKNSSFKIYLRHIKGHQNRHKVFSQLSPMAKLNIQMDTHAKKYFDSPEQAPKYSTFSKFLSADIASIRDPYSRIVTHFQENLSRFHTGSTAEQHMSDALNISPNALATLDWNNIRSTIRSYKGKRRFNMIRLIYNHLPTMKRNFTWKQASSPKCPLCSSPEEDPSHIFACSHSDMTTFRNEQLNELSEKLTSLHTCPLLRRHIICTIKRAHIHRKSPPILCQSNENQLLWNINHALALQHKIGLLNFMHGIITYAFGDCYDIGIKSLNIKTNLTGQTWSRKLILLLQQFSWSLWQKRCNITSKINASSYESFLRNECKNTFYSAKKNNLLPFSSRYLLDKNPNYFSIASIHNLSSWLRRVQLAISQARNNNKTAKNDIRNWFSKPTLQLSPSNPPPSSTFSKIPKSPSSSTSNTIQMSLQFDQSTQQISLNHSTTLPSTSLKSKRSSKIFKKQTFHTNHNKTSPKRPIKNRRPITKRHSTKNSHFDSHINQPQFPTTKYLLTPPIPFQTYLRKLGRKNPPINPTTGK